MKHTDACEIPLASSLLTSTVPMGRNCTIFKIVSFIKGISLTLLANTNSISNDNAEIINVNCDDIVITATQTEVKSRLKLFILLNIHILDYGGIFQCI